MAVRDFIASLNPLWGAAIIIVSSFVAGAGGYATLEAWAGRDAENIEALDVRLSLAEATLCLPEAVAIAGVDRDRYCYVVSYIREKGLLTTPIPLPGGRAVSSPDPQ